MSVPDYMQPGFIFCQPCRFCFARIEFTRGNAPADFFCSDKCREESSAAHVKQLREGFKDRLLRFLADNEAVINCSCQTGCDLICEVAGEEVAEFCCRIPDSKSVETAG